MRCVALSRFNAVWLARNAEVLQDKRIEFRVGINVGDVIIERK